MSGWRWWWLQTERRLWVHTTLLALLGGIAAVLTAVLERYIPWELPGVIGAEAVDGLLSILASSMLAVTTFSLSVMVSAYASATSNVTPRATRLLMEDKATQNTLAIFVGSFLFSIVGLVVLKTGAYDDRGRFLLFLMTIAVILLIVIALLRWIDYLTRLGRVGETTDRVEAQARKALRDRVEAPCLGGKWFKEISDIPASAVPVKAECVGYVQFMDMPALSQAAEALEVELFITAMPGTCVYHGTVLFWMLAENKPEPDLLEGMRSLFSVGRERSFDQDPRFGLAVLSEIGSRALSPATNDSGTALDVISRVTRLLALWAEAGEGKTEAEVLHPRLHVLPLQADDLFEDAFMLMARDGAALIEVQLRLQKALRALAQMGSSEFRAAARKQADMAWVRAEAALTMDVDRLRLRAVVVE